MVLLFVLGHVSTVSPACLVHQDWELCWHAGAMQFEWAIEAPVELAPVMVWLAPVPRLDQTLVGWSSLVDVRHSLCQLHRHWRCQLYRLCQLCQLVVLGLAWLGLTGCLLSARCFLELWQFVQPWRSSPWTVRALTAEHYDDFVAQAGCVLRGFRTCILPKFPLHQTLNPDRS